MRLILISVLLLLSGCSSIAPKIETIDIDCGPEPKSDKLLLLDIKPYILIVDDEPHSCTSTKDYENMAINISNITTIIKQKSEIIQYYQRCINSYKKAPD